MVVEAVEGVVTEVFVMSKRFKVIQLQVMKHPYIPLHSCCEIPSCSPFAI
jgi:hypothetical protein